MSLRNPSHPGRTVRHACMEPLGLGVTETAQKLGVSRKRLSSLLNGRSGISPDMAVRLHKAFGASVAMWCRRQALYDVAQAQRKLDSIAVERIDPI